MTNLNLENIIRDKIANYEVPVSAGAWKEFNSKAEIPGKSAGILSSTAMKITFIASMVLIPVIGIYFLIDFGKEQKIKLLNRQNTIKNEIALDRDSLNVQRSDSLFENSNIIEENFVEEEIVKNPVYIFKPINNGEQIFFGPAEANEKDIKKFRMLIRNKKGDLIFESNNANDLWDGKIQGRERYANNGMYDWFIIIINQDSEKYRKRGKVKLER